jgi:hypothetical protein
MRGHRGEVARAIQIPQSVAPGIRHLPAKSEVLWAGVFAHAASCKENGYQATCPRKNGQSSHGLKAPAGLLWLWFYSVFHRCFLIACGQPENAGRLFLTSQVRAESGIV